MLLTMHRALATHQMFKDLSIDFLGNDEWPGSSPDLNPTENLGPIIMTKFDEALRSSNAAQYSQKNLMKVARKALRKLSTDTELFKSLITMTMTNAIIPGRRPVFLSERG